MWLRPGLSEEQRARMRQRANVHAGIELILVGVLLAPGYLFLSMMTFSDPSRTAMAVVIGFSVLLIGLGVTAIVRSRRS
jgi:hypothetical protein